MTTPAGLTGPKPTPRFRWLVPMLAWPVVVLVIFGVIVVAWIARPPSIARFAAIDRLAEAVAWPAAALLAVVAVRRELPNLLGRVSKVSVASVSLELAMPREPPASALRALHAISDPMSTEAATDSSGALFRAVTQRGRADVLTLDLGVGGSWLTTRLYLVSTIVCEALGLRCLVFVANEGPVRRRLVGLAEPTAVRRGLNAAYPYLQTALIRAAAATDWPDLANALAMPEPGREDRVATTVLGMAAQLESRGSRQPPEGVLQFFLNDSTVRRLGAEPDIDPGWVRLFASGTSGAATQPSTAVYDEHAEWITSSTLERLLGATLTRSIAVKSPGVGRSELLRQALTATDPFVAVVDDEGRFLNVIERAPLVERIANDVAERERARS
jgi:hypothetical protein